MGSGRVWRLVHGNAGPYTNKPLARQPFGHAGRVMTLPHSEPAAVAQWIADNANSGSLVRYLEGFAYTVEAMASEAACERIAFEIAEDARAEGCVMAEFRMAVGQVRKRDRG